MLGIALTAIAAYTTIAGVQHLRQRHIDKRNAMRLYVARKRGAITYKRIAPDGSLYKAVTHSRD